MTDFIPYGAELGKIAGTETLRALGLEPGRYFLYVSRMEPENNPLAVRQAFEQVRTDYRLALIGDAPYSRDYIRQVRDTSDPRIVMPAITRTHLACPGRSAAQRCAADPGPLQSVAVPDQRCTAPQALRAAPHPGHDRKVRP